MTTRRNLGALALTILLVAGLGACGVSAGEVAERATSTTSAGPSPTGADPGGSGTTTTEALEPGSTFESPDGWSMETGEDWVEGPTPMKGMSTWYTGRRLGDFRPNVGVIVQPGQGMDPQEYLDGSADSIGTVMQDGEIISSEVITADDGTELAVMEYAGSPGTQALLRFYAVAVRQGDDMVLATFTAPDAAYNDIVDDTEQLLQTLRAE